MFFTTKGDRLHIAVFGRCNAGKSSLINALVNQNLAIVSNRAGTTTDPVYKAMEILPIGPVMFIDTAGIDDESSLGKIRKEKTIDILNVTDIALLVIDIESKFTEFDKELVENSKSLNIPLIFVLNKSDLNIDNEKKISEYKSKFKNYNVFAVSAKEKQGIEELKKMLIKNVPKNWKNDTIIGDLISDNEICILVTPIDKAAPKNRLILPQVQLIRDIIDNNALVYVIKENQLKTCINSLKQSPKIVITDSQVFSQVEKDTPEDILLTSFSILFARYKGNLETFINGVKKISRLHTGSKVLIAETCTHHRVEGDIGSVKIPELIKQKYGEVNFSFCTGREFPADLQDYDLVVHCGGCMTNRRDILHRINVCNKKNVSIVNYGIALAYLNGILKRVLSPWPNLQKRLN